MSRLFFSRYAFQVVLPPVYACSHIRQILKAPKLTGLQIHAQSRDSDSRYEPLAVLGPETGELSELERMNGEGEAERFIRQLEEPAWAGIEACGTASGLPRFCSGSGIGVPWCTLSSRHEHLRATTCEKTLLGIAIADSRQTCARPGAGLAWYREEAYVLRIESRFQCRLTCYGIFQRFCRTVRQKTALKMVRHTFVLLVSCICLTTVRRHFADGGCLSYGISGWGRGAAR